MKENFDKNEAPIAPESVVSSEDIDLDAIEKQILGVELAAGINYEETSKLQREMYKKKTDEMCRIIFLDGIAGMVKGNVQLDIKTRQGDYLRAIYKFKEHDRIEDKIFDANSHELNVLFGEKDRLIALISRVDTLLKISNFELQNDFILLREKLQKKLLALKAKISSFYIEYHDLQKSWSTHEKQQQDIAENPVAFAIETVRASNPEEFDRLFPDIEALKKEIEKDIS